MDLQSLNVIDVLLGGTVLISALIGLMRGLVREILSLAAWLVAVWAGINFSEMVSNQFVQQVINDKHIAYIASFGAVFFTTLFLIGLLNLLISSLFKATGLGGFDRLLGMLFGLARGVIISAVIVFFARLYPNIESIPAWQQSELKPGFANLANWGIARIPEHMRAYADSWLNPDSVSIIPQKPPILNGENTTTEITLTSFPTQNPAANTQAARPQLSAEQLRQQAAQNNSLAEQPVGLELSSLQDPNYVGEIEESPQELSPEATEAVLEAPAPLQLESLNNQ